MMNLPSTPSQIPNDAVGRLAAYFEQLTPGSVAYMEIYYAPQARFKDPFNDVTGLPAIQTIFSHMFVALESPRFVVLERIAQGNQCFLTWEFRFRFRNFKQTQEQVILGSSHLVFAEDGKVTLHSYYWDTAVELYENLPLIGSLMRWLKKRANS
jgi:hypothetical protein